MPVQQKNFQLVILSHHSRVLSFCRTREAVVRNRQTTDPEHGGGYTDLEVLEVIDPARAARIRLRQAR